MRTFARAAALLIAMVALAACTGEAPKPSSTSSDGGSWFDAPVSIPRFLNGYGFEGEPLNIYAITHLVVRGTYIPGTVRCTIQETLDQPTKRPPYHPQSSDSYGSVRYINCFADLRVNDYIVGTGSPKLTILVFRTRSTTTRADARAVRSSLDKTFIRGEWNTRVLYQAPDGGIEGREGIFFLGPTWDHSMKVLDSYGTWGVEQKDDGTVIAVHPQREHWSSWPNYEADFRHLVEIPLATFKTKVQEAHADRLAANGGRIGTATALPMLITDANNLAIYYTGDGYVDPPPPCGLAVPDQIATPQLLLDCIALLGAKDALRGTGTLNWSADKAITTWDGVSTNATGSEGAASGETGTATHVTKVELVNKGLTGSVPESLGKVERLTTLKLSGNTLTGCLPSELRDVAQSDLSQLDLKYCDPGAPGPITGVVTRTSIALSWETVEDASTYRIEYIKAVASGVWTVADSTLTTTSYTVTGLTCGTPYRFRISALGSGPDVQAVWSDPSLSKRVETAPCKPPAPGAAGSNGAGTSTG